MKNLSDLINTNETHNATINHKTSAECFTKCSKWKLSCTVTCNKTSTGLIFTGKAYFFKKVTSSILSQLQMLDSSPEISKATIKNLEETAYGKENNQSDINLDFSAIKFPLENSEQPNELIGVFAVSNGKEVNPLENMVFFECDVNCCNISKEQMKCLREMNIELMEKEIHFSLNATIHGVPMFKKEIRFSVDGRKFMKSVQFRIEEENQIQNGGAKLNFFTMIISNPSMGIEFNKPRSEKGESSQSQSQSQHMNQNIFSNANITLSKIYLEINISNEILNSDKLEGLQTKNSSTCSSKLPDTSSSNSHSSVGEQKSQLSSSITYAHNRNFMTTEKSIYDISSSDDNSYSYRTRTKKGRYAGAGNNSKTGNGFSNNRTARFTNEEVKPSIKNYQIVAHQSYQKQSMHHRLQILQVLLSHYDGLCNFLIFAKSCAPYVNNSEEINQIKMQQYFACFEKSSIFGLDVHFIYDNAEYCQVVYSPTLSAMNLLINDAAFREDVSKSYSSSNMGIYSECDLILGENLSLNCGNKRVRVEYYETRPPHCRNIMLDQIRQVLKDIKNLGNVSLEKVDDSSWFCVLWSPTKSSRSQFGNTSFLVYYQFSYTVSQIDSRGYEDYSEVPIIGILPVKFEEGLWLRKIRKGNAQRVNLASDNIDFQLTFNDSINNVHDFVFSRTDRTSVDYDFYVKSNIAHSSMITIR